MSDAPITVAEIDSFDATARKAGLTEEERNRLADFLAKNPEAGDLIRGTGGLRKLRWGGRGKGKSGGYRAIYYFFDREIPIFLLAIYAKAMKEDLTPGEKRQVDGIGGNGEGTCQDAASRTAEMSKIGEDLIKGMTNAIAHIEGRKPARRTHTFVVAEVPPRIDVAAIRRRLHMTQAEFAARFGFSVRNIQNWEQGLRQPEGSARAYLLVIARNPKEVEKALASAA